MQPRSIVILIIVLPLFTVNAAYLISAFSGKVAWCIPYISGCTSISQAARLSDAIFLFRAGMIVYAVLLIFYWRLKQQWLNMIDQRFTFIALIIFLLGASGAAFLILYVDYLGTTGVMYRFMRRFGVIFYFSFTPLAHTLMLNHLYKLKKLNPDFPISLGVLRYQLSIVSLMIILGLVSVIMRHTGTKTFESESLIEWNYALLLTLIFAGSFYMWKDLKLQLTMNNSIK